MKKPFKHTCLDCGNVYYYRSVRCKDRYCPVCGGLLKPEGYFSQANPFGTGYIWRKAIPMPPPRKCKEEVSEIK